MVSTATADDGNDAIPPVMNTSFNIAAGWPHDTTTSPHARARARFFFPLVLEAAEEQVLWCTRSASPWLL